MQKTDLLVGRKAENEQLDLIMESFMPYTLHSLKNQTST